MRYLVVVLVSLLLAGYASALPNSVWQEMRAQAVQADDQQMLRVLDFVGKAGTVLCQPGWAWCQERGTNKVSCCGRGDAYEADKFRVDSETGALVATLTCNDPEINCPEIKGRVSRPVGTEFVVPSATVLVSRNPRNGEVVPPVNDTGHGFIWVNNNNVVVCWAAPPGE